MFSKSLLPTMEHRTHLVIRVNALFDVRQQRGRAGSIFTAFACALMALLVTMLSPLMVVANSQTVPDTKPKFEVATVKQSPPSQSDALDINLGTVRNGVVTLGNVTLNECLKFAYGIVSDAQISGPDWAKSRAIRFDIVAKAPPDTDRAKLLLMTQELLSERLKIVLHNEQKELSFLALTVGKNGPKFHVAAVGSGGNTGSRGQVHGEHMTMAVLAMLLSRFEHQIIIDMTGLKEQFEFQLAWSPDPISGVTNDAGGPSIFSAVQDQLGLKLEPQRGPIDILVIDHAEKMPTEN